MIASYYEKKLGRYRDLRTVFSKTELIRFKFARRFGRGMQKAMISSVSSPVYWRAKESDSDVLLQIFLQLECDIVLTDTPTLIIDGGANCGYATLFFAKKFPNAQIVAIEPHPENCEMFKRNCANARVQLLRGALWPTAQTLSLNNPASASWAFQVSPSSESPGHDVQGYTLQQCFDLHPAAKNILVKLDIEGAELQLFTEGDQSWIDRISALVIEVHGSRAEKAVKDAMIARGFKMGQIGEKLMFTRR
jgi:FkbM family methyltransferase